MSICPYAQELGCHWYVHYTKKSMDDGVGWTMFLGDGGWGGQRSMSLCNVCIWWSQVKKQVLNAEKERTRKSSKTRIGEPSLARLGLPLNQQRTISDTCSTRPTFARNAHRHTGTWCTIGMCTMFNALFVTILSLAHVSDTASYCKIGILSTSAYIWNQQPGWVLIFKGAYFHWVLINECAVVWKQISC